MCDSVVVFLHIGPAYKQKFSSNPIDRRLLGQIEISKNANNVVISGPIVVIFSKNIVLFHSFPYIWSRDHAHFWFRQQTGGVSICSIPCCPFPFSCPTKSAVQSKNVLTYHIAYII